VSGKILSIKEILDADDVTFATAEAWGGTVRFGSLDAGTMMEFIKNNQGPGKHTAGLRIFIQSLVDENGNRIGNLNQLEAFKKKNAAVLRHCVDNVILKLNGFGSKSVDISTQLKEAGTDPVKLQKLSAELRKLADAVDAAGVDERKLEAIMDDVQKAETEEAREEAKNGSGEAP